jgi:hypothetical protein
MAQLLVQTDELQKLIAETVEQAVITALNEREKKEWMTSREVRELTGFSPSKLQNLRNSGQLVFAQHGKNIVYTTNSVNEFLEKRKIKKSS